MIHRRRFIQASALLIAGTSTLALTGCGSPKTPEDVACAFVRALTAVMPPRPRSSSTFPPTPGTPR